MASLNQNFEQFRKKFEDYFDGGNYQEVLQRLKEIALSKKVGNNADSSAVKACIFIIEFLNKTNDINVNVTASKTIDDTRKALSEILGKTDDKLKDNTSTIPTEVH